MQRQVNEAIETIQNTIIRQEAQIESLIEENKRLKAENYKDEELSKTKEQLDRALNDYRRGFPISERENKLITEWINKHLREKHWDHIHNCTKSFGAIGGNFSYNFIPTGIGTFGEIKCSCGASFQFQEP